MYYSMSSYKFRDASGQSARTVLTVPNGYADKLLHSLVDRARTLFVVACCVRRRRHHHHNNSHWYRPVHSGMDRIPQRTRTYIHLSIQHSWDLGSKSDPKHEATPKFLSAALRVKGSPQLPVGVVKSRSRSKNDNQAKKGCGRETTKIGLA